MTRHRFTALAILVIALLFQWTWAAAAGLCRHDGHENTHFGHHGHVASLHVKDAGQAGAQAKTLDDGTASWPASDCGCCHAWVAAPSLERLAPAAVPSPPADFSEPPPRYDSVAELRPDRPRWQG
ncbi:Uncharacterised protein [Delftia tsuruhatensis]|uniref:hypothetical protein n=1 Tax=Delftia tsuruhatensis TaxID=180282 RepID=UPI001E76774F|nr:hypothetical protein [Delftia tsuruhatensis]CAB5676223.1 Uncharacterised protein [Delftia tsuruhatensis]CAC9692774.1 Uncharacterised protein [Delftia tsuruhatensis]